MYGYKAMINYAVLASVLTLRALVKMILCCIIFCVRYQIVNPSGRQLLANISITPYSCQAYIHRFSRHDIDK